MNTNAQKRAKLRVNLRFVYKKSTNGDGLWHLPNDKTRFYGS